jgi:cytochrome c5
MRLASAGVLLASGLLGAIAQYTSAAEAQAVATDSACPREPVASRAANRGNRVVDDDRHVCYSGNLHRDLPRHSLAAVYRAVVLAL